MLARYKYSRYSMYTHIERFFQTTTLKPGSCLIIGDSLDSKTSTIKNPTLFNMLPKGCTVLAPTYPEVDMQDMPYKDNTFDYVLTDQVLEHVRKPWVGVEEIRRVLKPGGLAVITSALLFPVHGVPYDFFRFTPEGLLVLCENFSKIHECSGTGDLNFAIKVLQNKATGQVSPGSVKETEAMAIDGKNIVSVWTIVEK